MPASTSRVLFIGPSPRVYLPTVRYLRDQGIDARLLVLTGDDDPGRISTDAWDVSFMPFRSFAGWGDPTLFSAVAPRQIAADLEGFDCLVGSGAAPAVLHRVGRKLDLFVPTGSDVFDLPYRQLRRVRRAAPGAIWQLPLHQREGIRESLCVLGPVSHRIDHALGELGARGARLNVVLPPMYAPDYTEEALQHVAARSAWILEFRRVRQAADVFFVHAAPHNLGPATTGGTGSDRILRAFDQLRRALPGKRCRLVTFDLGPHVTQAKALTTELGLGETVEWFPAMYRKEMLLGMSLADACCGALGDGWPYDEVALDAMGLGVPVVAAFNAETSVPPAPEVYPLEQAHDEASAFSHMLAIASAAKDPGLTRKRKRWFQAHIEQPVAELRAFVERANRPAPGQRPAVPENAQAPRG